MVLNSMSTVDQVAHGGDGGDGGDGKDGSNNNNKLKAPGNGGRRRNWWTSAERVDVAVVFTFLFIQMLVIFNTKFAVYNFGGSGGSGGAGGDGGKTRNAINRASCGQCRYKRSKWFRWLQRRKW
jgi:hypothetical protein